MGTRSDHERRQWKLAAMRALAASKSISSHTIRANIGRGVLDNLLNETFALHPHDPGEGAATIRNALITIFGQVSASGAPGVASELVKALEAPADHLGGGS